MKLNPIINTTLALFMLLIIVGCGNDSSTIRNDSIIIKGSVQKGAFTQLTTVVFPMDENTGVLGVPVTTTSTDSHFELVLDGEGFYQIQATGSFINEINGETVELTKPLLFIIHTDEVKDQNNINLFTHLSALRTNSNFESGQSLKLVMDESNDFIRDVFSLEDSTDFSQLSWENLTADTSLLDPNLQLLLFSASVMWDMTEIEYRLTSQQAKQNIQYKRAITNGIIAFNSYITDFGSFETVEDAADAMSVLEGNSAVSLYQVIVANVPGLPSEIIELNGIQMVFLCIAPAACSWQVYEAPVMTLVWSPVERIRRRGTTSFREAYAGTEFEVRLSTVSVIDMQVEFTSEEIGATKGIDYRSSNQIITIPAGVTQVSVDAPIFIDNLSEGLEEVKFTLVQGDNSYLLGRATHQFSINNDYGEVTVDSELDSQIEISSSCLSAMGDGLNIQSTGCIAGQPQALPSKSTAAVGFDMTFSIVCDLSDEGNCHPQDRDWQVEINLEASNASGNNVAEFSLGFYRFQGERLNPEKPSEVQTVYAHIDDEFRLLLDKAETSNWALQFTTRLTETSQPSLAESLLPPLELPSQIIAGDQILEYQIIGFTQTDDCNGNNYSITAEFSLDDQTYTESTICVALDQSGSEPTATLIAGKIDLSGQQITLPAFHSSHIAYGSDRVQTMGANSLIIPNPNEADQHGSSLAAVATCEQLDCYYGQDLLVSDEQSILPLSIYLAAESLPFAFAITSGWIDTTGLNFAYNKTKYLHAGEYSNQDTRSVGDVQSNDVFYKGTGGFSGAGTNSGMAGQFKLTSSGIQDQVVIAGADEGKTAFPKSKMNWSNFSAIIENSQIIIQNSLPVDFELSQTTQCEKCANGGTNNYRLKGDLNIGSTGLAFSSMNLQNEAGFNPSWGNIGTNKAFKRYGDLQTGQANRTAMVALPGYHFPDLQDGTQGDQQSEQPAIGMDIFLQGHVEFTEQQLTLHSSKSAAGIEGNEWPTGISLGPQYYYPMDEQNNQQNTGQPLVGIGRNLDDVPLLMNNGIDPEVSLSQNIGVKYVIRNAGITGVFNANIDPQMPESIPFYGYQMNFDRFAFRLTDNTHKKFSWIDGQIYLPGETSSAGLADFTTEFSSLELNCNGKLESGSVTYCTGPDCVQQRLRAWSANTDVVNMKFQGENGELALQCSAENQQLALEQTVDMKAIDIAIGLKDVLWTPQGFINESEQTRLTQLQNFRLDTKQTNEVEHQGFAVSASKGRLRVINDGVSVENYGVLELTDAMIVPGEFWKAMRADIRLANITTDNPDRSVVVASGQLPNLGDDSNNTFAQFNSSLNDYLIKDSEDHQYSPYAKYNWNGSNFSFELPVYYDSGSRTTSASYFGRYREKDLLVMQAGAGIDYIRPDTTALSFGASANIPEIGSLGLRVDLSDYASLQSVDSLLSGLGVSDFSLADTFNSLSPDLLNVSQLANNGMNGAISEALDSLLIALGDTAIAGGELNLWQELTEPMVAIASLPEQINVVISDDLSVNFEQNIYQESLTLQLTLKGIQDIITLPAITNTPLDELDLSIQAAIVDSFDRVTAQTATLKQASATLAQEFERTEQRVLSLITQAIGDSEQQIDGQLTRLQGSLNSLQSTLATAVDINTYCSAAQMQKNAVLESAQKIQIPTASNLLEPMMSLSSSIDQATATFRDFSNIANAISSLVSDGSEMAQRLSRVTQNIQDKANQLDINWTDAKTELKDIICEQSGAFVNPDNFLVEVNTLLMPLIEQMAVLEGVAADLKSTVEDNLAVSKLLLDAQSNAITRIEGALSLAKDSIRQQAEDLTLADINQQLIDSLSEIPTVPGVPAINVLYASPEITGSVDLHIAIIEPLQFSLQILPNQIRERMPTIEFPGAYFNADDFRRMVKRKIMDSNNMGALYRILSLYVTTSVTDLLELELSVTDYINEAIVALLAEVASPLNDLLAEATASIPKLPVGAASINGRAKILGNALEMLRIDASWETAGQSDDAKGNGFVGVFEALRYTVSADDPAASCGLSPGTPAFDAYVMAAGPIDVGGDDAYGKVELNFMFDESDDGISAYLPVTFDGGFSLEGEMEKEPFMLYNFNFGVGIGRTQAYIGAGGAGSFESTELTLNAFIGRSCVASVVSDLDPEVAQFLDFQDDEPFTGVYSRGSATVPVFGGSCMLDVAVRANIGMWLTAEPTVAIGGLFGGGAQGSLVCLGSVRGEVTTAAEYDLNNNLYFVGDAYVIAGIGDCERRKWTNISRSRDDSWCGTADMGIGVEYRDKEWSYDLETPSAFH